MRLLFVNERVEYASSASYSMDLALALMDRGDEVRLCTHGGALLESFRVRGIETYQVRYNLFSFRKLLSFLRDYDPDLLHVQSLRSFPLGRRLAAKLRKPCIVTVHRRPTVDAPDLHSPYLRGVISINEVVREALVNERGIPKGAIRTIKRGIFFPRPKFDGADWARIEGRLPVVGSIGRLVVDKGHHILVEAASLLERRGVHAHYTIAGEGPEERNLRAQVKRLGLESCVTFAPSLARRSDLYSLFDFVALPVLSSGVGVTALEAMAMGKPLIASGVGELLHIVQDGANGLLVPEGDASKFADRIAELIGDPEFSLRLARQARKFVEENFALEPMVEATRAYYEEVLSSDREEQGQSAR